MKSLISIFIITFMFWSNAYAYLDPASGGIILQLIIAGITGSIAYILFYYRKFKDFLKNIFKKKEKTK
jgi:O-antigen/teichoic acid export membrane protein